jgi:hypothetical protein
VTPSIKPYPLPALGDSLPPGSRFWVVPMDAPGVARGTVIAFVPCRQFQRDGLHVLRASTGFELRHCRALEDGAIEVASLSGAHEVAEDSLRDIVEGRVIGIGIALTTP